MTIPAPTADPPAPPRRPWLIRPAALWLVPVTILVLLALLPLVVQPWLAAQVRRAVELAGLQLAPETTIDVSVLGGRITMRGVDVREVVDGAPRSLFKADLAELDADLLACLGGALVLDRVAIEGASGDLRRRGDGTIPLATPPPDERDGKPWDNLDWWSHLRRSAEWYAKRDRAAPAEGEPTPPAAKREPTPKPAHDWSGARRYEPAPDPRQPGMHVLVRQLTVSGRELLLPDDTPFAVTTFSAVGASVGWNRRPSDGPWSLDLQAQTRGAGGLDLAFGSSRIRAHAAALPLETLAHPALAGDAIARHGVGGTADLVLDAAWPSELSGTIAATVTGLTMRPQEPTAQQRQVAQVLDRLGGRPVAWRMVIGGTPEDPRIVDDGLQDVVAGSLADAAKEAAIEEGTRRLQDELQKNEKVKELQERKDVQRATDKAKDLLKGLGR